MAQFFIDRPIFAWVIALFVLVMGSVAITQLPIAQFPTVAPPAIIVSAVYPGASAQTLENTVISVIEKGYTVGDRVLRPARVVVSAGGDPDD